MPCGGAGYAKSITNEHASQGCPNECTTQNQATNKCNRPRWSAQCDVKACTEGGFKCTEKSSPLPELVQCQYGTGNSGPLFRADDGTLYPIDDFSGGLNSSDPGVWDVVGLQGCLESNDLVLADTVTLFDGLVAAGCGISPANYDESSGSCVIDSSSCEAMMSFSCFQATLFTDLDFFLSIEAHFCAIRGANIELPDLCAGEIAPVTGICREFTPFSLR